MTYNPEIHHRRSIRLRGFDYSAGGAYFVTVCVQGRECLFRDVADEEMVLNDAGRMVENVWTTLPERFPAVISDEFVVMPNHYHGIVVINDVAEYMGVMNKGAMNCAPTSEIESTSVGARFIAPNKTIVPRISVVPPLGEIIRVFKAVTTRLIRRDHNPDFSWQRNYYERIIRNEAELNAARKYIVENPMKWAEDNENPAYIP